ncbi:uncharacterized protein LOC117642355 [Thrips palmi]|uniref:DNA-directed DNA polymerase n=1 Tax=Thrips palmi TaxID=161013 RepID=A0A6P8YI84_THRPL|nr:uncharacterized protein LOC117642355 [Thrips palmi]
MSKFITYLQSFGAKTELLIVAHNAKAFDAVFVLQELVARRLRPELVLNGAKILNMKLNTWSFIDSLMFLPMPLSALPKAFGLTELKKGYFPFLANTRQYYNYEGPLPEREMYCVSGMKAQSAIEFNRWYDDQVEQGAVFNFKRELVDYCISDVTILRQACQSFRKLFAESAGFDPMFHSITLSSAVMNSFRKLFLLPNSIGIVPPGGYHGRGKQSHMALQWLDWEQHKLGQSIKTIYTDRPEGGENRYERTQRITALFKKAGYVVIEKWECDWNEDLKTPEVKAYFEAHPTTRSPPLDLRKALCGGRTSALRCYHKVDLTKGEKIKMADVVSEYPNANLRGCYPLDHPSIYLEGDPQMPPVDTWNGIVKCTVLPPRDLYLPVLPYKCNGKLMFPLCRTCVENESPDLCQHTNPLDRQLTGEWCAPELHLALQKGYTLIAIHEVYQYPRTMQ